MYLSEKDFGCNNQLDIQPSKYMKYVKYLLSTYNLSNVLSIRDMYIVLYIYLYTSINEQKLSEC